MDLATGKMTDYGFAVQPLIHTLKGRNFLIGGRYQMPVYRGSIPLALTRAQKLTNLPAQDQPRAVFKKLLE